MPHDDLDALHHRRNLHPHADLGAVNRILGRRFAGKDALAPPEFGLTSRALLIASLDRLHIPYRRSNGVKRDLGSTGR